MAEDDSDLARAMARNSRFHAQPREAGDQQIIVVTGAGTSNAAANLPGGSEAAVELTERIRDGGVEQRLIDGEIERTALQYNLLERDFETVLLALSKFNRQSVQDELHAIFNRRYHPWIGYELLAHFLKHRFIDAVINFNFDEILDQAVEDELGEDAYHRVMLDGDCPYETSEWTDGTTKKFRLPLYVKPHGTASQPSSLRFTRDSYASIADGVADIIRELFKGGRTVHVLVLGHAMQSVEFNHLLRRASLDRHKGGRHHFLHFHFATPKETSPTGFIQGMADGSYQRHPIDEPGGLANPMPASLSGSAEGIRDGSYQCRYSGQRDGKDIVGNYLQTLWTAVQEHCDWKPRGVLRHELVSELFKYRWVRQWRDSKKVKKEEPNPVQIEEDKSRKRRAIYFRHRTLVELALAVAKAKGFASLDSLSGSRVGTYFRLYRDMKEHDVEGEQLDSITHACEKLGLKVIGYGASAVAFKSCDEEEQWKLRSIIVPQQVFEEQEADKLAEQLQAALDFLPEDMKDPRPEELRLTPEQSLKLIGETLKEMYKGDEVEVAGHGRDRNLSFESGTALSSLRALQLHTKELMSKTDWHAIVLTAKSGEWLVNNGFADALKKRPVAISLVVADMAHLPKLAENFGDDIEKRMGWLPWWMHNRNVTVFLDSSGEPIRALAFERRLRTTTIVPYLLEVEADRDSAWRTFIAYWVKAKRIANKEPEAERQITQEDMNRGRQEIVSLLYGTKTSAPMKRSAESAAKTETRSAPARRRKPRDDP
jgi:hypothetical protein